LSDPVQVSGGWAVLRVLEKKAFDPAAFEKDKASLMASLRQQRKEEMFRAYMQEARKKVTVQRNIEAFKRVTASYGPQPPARLRVLECLRMHVELRKSGDVVIVDVAGKLSAGLGY